MLLDAVPVPPAQAEEPTPSPADEAPADPAPGRPPPRAAAS
jgi:hypothetical protein